MWHEVGRIDACPARVNAADLSFVIVDELDRMFFQQGGWLRFDKRRHFITTITAWNKWGQTICLSEWSAQISLKQILYVRHARKSESGWAGRSWPELISRHRLPFPFQLYPYPFGLSPGAWFPPGSDWTASMIHLHRRSRCPIQFLRRLQLETTKKPEKGQALVNSGPDDAILDSYQDHHEWLHPPLRWCCPCSLLSPDVVGGFRRCLAEAKRCHWQIQSWRPKPRRPLPPLSRRL